MFFLRSTASTGPSCLSVGAHVHYLLSCCLHLRKHSTAAATYITSAHRMSHIYIYICMYVCMYIGMCSRGGTAPGSITHSETRHIFCLAGGVSSTDSPCVGLSMIAVGLGVCDLSCTSSVSHLMYLSKSPAMGSSVSVSICLYSTVGSPGGDWVAFGPAGTADGMG